MVRVGYRGEDTTGRGTKGQRRGNGGRERDLTYPQAGYELHAV